MTFLFLMAIIVNIELGTGEVLECETGRAVQYFPAARMLFIDRCEPRAEDLIFKDGFE